MLPLRKVAFISLGDMNEALLDGVAKLNEAKTANRRISRRELVENEPGQLDRCAGGRRIGR